MPAPGRIALTPMLNPKGRLIGDFTVAHVAPERFHLTASYAAQAYHMRWFEAHLPARGVALANASDTRIGFQIAGPEARRLLERLVDEDVSTAAFPFLSVRELDVGSTAALVARISYTGDLGYEITVAAAHQVALHQALTEAGREFGLRPFGMRAMMSLRLEKSFGAWQREYRPDYTAAETGLDRFISFAKNDFVGRDAAMAERDAPLARRLCTFVVDAADSDAWGDEPIWRDDEVVGFVTSGGYAHFVERSVALGFVPLGMVEAGAKFEIELLGERRPATLIAAPLFDPDGKRMRG